MGRLRFALCVLPVGLVGLLLLAFSEYTTRYGRTPQRPGADVVVVLGCGLKRGGVGPILGSRLDRGFEVYRAEREWGGDPLVVVSGGLGDGDVIAEADAMGEYLEAAGVPGERIVRERRSRNTRENLRFTSAELRARGMRPDKVRMTLVTSDFHVLRTAALARRFGLRAQVVGARTARYFVRKAFLREFVAVLVSYLPAGQALSD